MKKYMRPELKAEIIMDVNEPVYMACSGSTLFVASAIDREHQVPQEGRLDCRYQVDATTGQTPVFHHEGNLYFYYVFDRKVVATRSSDFNIISTNYLDDGRTLVIAVKDYTVQQGQHIGFGDLFAEYVADPSENIPAPTVTVAFGYNPGGCY